MRGKVSRRVITSTDEFLDVGLTGRILPILVRPGAIYAELIRAHLGSLVVDAVYCSLPLALRGETAADRVWLAAPMNGTGSGKLNGEPLSLDPPADSGRPFPVRFLHEEFSGVNRVMSVLPLACPAACPGVPGSGAEFGWPSGAVAGTDRVGAGQAAAAGGPQAVASRFSHSCSRGQPSGRCKVR